MSLGVGKRGWKALRAVPPQAEAWPPRQIQGEDLSSPSCMSGGRDVLGGGRLSDPCPPTASSDDMTLTSPSMDNSSAELLPSGDSPLNKRMTENLLASLSEHERAAILSVPAAQNPEDLRMFARWGRGQGARSPSGEGQDRKWMGLYPATRNLNPLRTDSTRWVRGCPCLLPVHARRAFSLLLRPLSVSLSSGVSPGLPGC